MDFTTYYEDVSRNIDELSGLYLSFLRDICNIESNSYDKAGVDKVSDYITAYEAPNGYQIERQKFDRAGDCLCIDWLNDEKKPYIVMSAHLDTVHKKGDFGYRPVRLSGDFIYGPGVCDCKGGVAVGLLVMAALKKSKFNGINIRLLLQSDEEVSSALSNKGTIDYICNKAKGALAFFNLEGRIKGEITIRRAGIIHTRFCVKGKAAHSKDKNLGINAINEAALKINELANSALNETVSLNCGKISGGSASNIVPETCSFDVEARFWTKEEYVEVMKFFKEVAERQYVSGTKTELTIVSDRMPMELKDFNLDLLDKVSSISEKYGFGKLKQRQSFGGSDAAYTTAAGIPTLDGLGMVGYGLHSVNERAEIKSLAESAKMLSAIILEMSI